MKALTQRRSLLYVMILIFASFLVSACEENLPVYERPADIVAVSLSHLLTFRDLDGADWDVIDFRIPPPAGLLTLYHVSFTNNFDEVLEDSVDIRGELVIWFEHRPHLRATVPITATAPQVMIQTHEMIRGTFFRILPGDTFRIRVTWDGRLDNGQMAYTVPGIASSNDLGPSITDFTTLPAGMCAQVRFNAFKRLQTVPSDEMSFSARFRWRVHWGP